MEESSTKSIDKLDEVIKELKEITSEIKTLRYAMENLKAKFDKMF